ncbi:MAG: hypothetical protein HY360_22860 [Verrucomicrobia bacterium]|nr:hypothetical protein [Verrucomicrobiota bacterium]
MFLIIESMLHLGVAWALVRQHFSEEASVLRRLGPLCPPVAAGGGVFVLEILFFEWGAGGAFWMQALLFSAGFFVLLTLGQAALGMAVPRWETRLELKVFTHVMLALLGMVLPLLVQGAGAIPAGVPVKGEAFAGTATLLLAGAAVGYLFQRRETVS